MKVENNRDYILRTLNVLKSFMQKKELFGKDKQCLELERQRYDLIWNQIHNYLVEQGDKESEQEIREYVAQVIKYDIPVCESKLLHFSNLKKRFENQKDQDKADLTYKYLSEWNTLYENFYAIAAFRSLEHWAKFYEWDYSPEKRLWVYSLDPYNDGGYTGLINGFYYYANQAVTKGGIKFIEKQMPTGCGKCVLPSTKVLTPNGYTTIADLKVGDFVMSMKNNELVARKVLNKWYSKKPQIRVSTRGNESIVCSPEHKLLTQRGYIKAEELTTKDYLYRLCKEWQPNDCYKVCDEELSLVTCMLFDGHCKRNVYNFTKMPDTLIFDKFIHSLNQLGIKYSIYGKDGTDCKSIRLLQNEHLINNIMQEYGLEGCLSKDKRLPKQFFNLSLEDKYKVIGMMFATDGYFGYSTGITLSSQGLTKDIQQLLDTCGIYSTINAKTIKKDNKTYNAWVLTIPNEYLVKLKGKIYCYDKQNKFEDLVKQILSNDTHPYCINTNYPKELLKDCKPFRRLTRKFFYRNSTFKRETVENFNSNNHLVDEIIYKDFVWESIEKISVDNEVVDMIDIEVEDTHNFVAENIVSHNSYSDIMFMTFAVGISFENDILKVFGNPSSLDDCGNYLKDIFISKRFAKVFPKFQKFHEMDGDIVNNVFKVCKISKEVIITINGSSKTNIRVVSKDKKISGVRARFILIDDITQQEDTNNVPKHEKDWGTFWGVWYKRRYTEGGTCIIASGTTYHFADILSRLKAYFSEGTLIRSKFNKYTYLNEKGDCVFVTVPKLDYDTGETTLPQKYSTADGLKIKERDEREFYAMEQQDPLPPENSPFYKDNLLTYEAIPTEGRSDFCWASLDPARKGFDNISMPIFTKIEDKHYLIDCIYVNKPMDEVYQMIIDKIIQHNITKFVIENNTDTSLKSLLNKMLMEQGITFCEILEVYATINKEVKIYNTESTIKNNIVFPRDTTYGLSSQMGRFMHDIISFTYDGHNLHDDSIDSVATYCQKMIKRPIQARKVKLLYV